LVSFLVASKPPADVTENVPLLCREDIGSAYAEFVDCIFEPTQDDDAGHGALP
jgi:hypothetical protein